MSKRNGLKRVHERFEKEINEIIKYVKENYNKTLTFVKATEMLVKHKNWPLIKEDIALNEK